MMMTSKLCVFTDGASLSHNLYPFPFFKMELKVLKWGLATGGACFEQHVAAAFMMIAPIISTMKAPPSMMSR